MTLVCLPCSLTFVHTDFNGSTIWANAVAADTHVSTRVGHFDIRDEQSTDVGAVITSLERTYKNETNYITILLWNNTKQVLFDLCLPHIWQR